MIRRRLTSESANPSLDFGQDELLARHESLVILGEAGMGKTELAMWLEEQEGVVRCTARQLLNRNDPGDLVQAGDILVIDALDEAVARQEGEAVDQILRVLGRLGYPRFILTCRVADWRSATGLAAIAEQYLVKPLELRLQPFTLDDAHLFLAERLGAESAKELVDLYQGRKLGDLLGNPQTLTMLAEVAAREAPPASIGGLFERYADIAWFEHSDQYPDSVLEARGRDVILDALGAGYAALLLSGAEAISRAVRHRLLADDVALSDAVALPDANALGDALRSRLASALGTERFSWPHKRIAEFLAARWLARQAGTARRRRRLLALLQDRGLVPASLRGLHAWLAWHSPELAPAVIAADPMGLIEYGDADVLASTQTALLLGALQKLAVDDPWFLGRGHHPAQGLVQRGSIDTVRTLIASADTPVRLRLLLLEQITGSPYVSAFDGQLRLLILDSAEAFILRREAAFALARIVDCGEWPALVEQLRDQGSDDSFRLGLEIAGRVGYAPFSDDLLSELLTGLALTDHNTVGLFWQIDRNLPDDRLEGVLDRVAATVAALRDPEQPMRDHDLAGTVYAWVARRIALGGVMPEKLWSWLDPFGHRTSYRRDGHADVERLLKLDNELRRGVQRHVLFGPPDDKTLYMRGWELPDRSPGLIATADDVCVHLEAFGAIEDPDEATIEQWRDLVQLVKHDGEEGQEVRDAARPFAARHPELLAWLEKLPEPRVFEWQIKQEQRRAKAADERETQWAADRALYDERIEAMRAGGFAWLSGPAKAYLKLRHEIDGDLAAHQRIGQWLGPVLAEAAHEGFEAFLTLGPPYPSAGQIAVSHAEGKGWKAGNILVAAFAERQRRGVGLSDLSDERLFAGLFSLQHSPYEMHAGIEGVRAGLEAELAARGLREAAVRQWIEPQLEARRDHVSDLHSLLRDENRSDLGVPLAAEWLERYSDLPNIVEFELVDVLIRANQRDDLRRLAAGRRGMAGLNAERRLSWDAIDAWLDFETLTSRVDAAGGPLRELLWHLRARLGGGRWMGEDGAPVPLTPRQFSWIIRRFRHLWPSAHMPSGGAEGSHNAWDAAEFLRGLMARLGSETSDEAITLLAELCEAPEDGYTEFLRNAAAEQLRKRVEEGYRPSTLAEIAAVFRDEAPRTAADLQSVLLEELAVLAKRLVPGGDNANPITGFFTAKMPKGEEACRDHLLTLLRGQLPFGIAAEPEGQAADGKANDIACSLGPDLMVPVEIKGQWHTALWHSADTQLDRLYASDWRADRRGIFLVLWFGGTGKKLKSPPRGTSLPTTPTELRAALIAKSSAAQAGAVEIVVLDLSRS